MKTIAPALLAAIESGTVATLIKVTLVDGTVYGYTDHDAPLTVGGIEYTPAAGQSVLKMNLTSDATVSTQDVVAGWTPIISEQAVLEGRYDFAQVEFALASWGVSNAGSAPLVYVGTNYSTGASSISVPTGSKAGDMLLLVNTNGGPTATVPSGFTTISATAAGCISYRIMQAGDSSFTLNESDFVSLTAISCADGVSIDASGVGPVETVSGTYSSPQLSASTPSDFAFMAFFESYQALTTPSPGFTVPFSWDQNGTGGCGLALAYTTLSASGIFSGTSCGFAGLTSSYPGQAAMVLLKRGAGIVHIPGTSLGSIPIFGGRIGKITYIDKGFSAQAFSNMWNLSQYIGIEFTANCRHKFGATQDPQGVGGCFYNASGQIYKGAIVGTIINAVEFYVGMNSATPSTPNSPNAPQLSAAAVLPSTSGGTQYLAPTEGAPYAYSVSAIVDGIESPTSPMSAIYTTLYIQGMPTFWQSLFQVVLPGNAVGSTITLNWNAVSGATAYNIYGRFNQTLLATVSGSTLTWTDNGSASGGTIAPPYGDFFSQGFLTMTSGAANGLSREVKFCHSGKLQLWLPLERPVAVGDTFNVQVGCVKTLPACQYKFANQLNYGGYPGIKPQALYTTPQTGTGSSVKK
jgi:hypothetical protein